MSLLEHLRDMTLTPYELSPSLISVALLYSLAAVSKSFCKRKMLNEPNTYNSEIEKHDAVPSHFQCWAFKCIFFLTLLLAHIQTFQDPYTGNFHCRFISPISPPSPVGELKTGPILSIMLEQNMCLGEFKTGQKIHWAKNYLYTVFIYYQPNNNRKDALLWRHF